ncbi:MAG: hypothetical protein Q8K60_06895 [Parachlamydiaceae bacterium]|nr:hypothetical protein [Parachlamydiaceae bacterium]
MTTHAFEKEYLENFNDSLFNRGIKPNINPSINELKKILRSHVLFNILFILLLSTEIIYFVIHLAFFIQTFVLAIHLAIIFATIFCYFSLHMYANNKKIEKLAQLKSLFLQKCEKRSSFSKDQLNHHRTIAESCCEFAAELHGLEYTIFPCPNWCQFLSLSIEKINCFLFWHDLHLLKETLLQSCIDEHIKLVRLEPIDLEAHAGLANAYVMLSGLYVDPRTVEGLDDDRWIPPNKYNPSFKSKFRTIAERAIEEFKILSDYAPNDPWVHAQLAFSYHDLQMPNEEIKEYETLIKLCPEDKETFFKLGKLYFEQGENAKGLQIYEILKQANYKKAENLILFYGAYSASTHI